MKKRHKKRRKNPISLDWPFLLSGFAGAYGVAAVGRVLLPPNDSVEAKSTSLVAGLLAAGGSFLVGATSASSSVKNAGNSAAIGASIYSSLVAASFLFDDSDYYEDDDAEFEQRQEQHRQIAAQKVATGEITQQDQARLLQIQQEERVIRQRKKATKQVVAYEATQGDTSSPMYQTWIAQLEQEKAAALAKKKEAEAAIKAKTSSGGLFSPAPIQLYAYNPFTAQIEPITRFEQSRTGQWSMVFPGLQTNTVNHNVFKKYEDNWWQIVDQDGRPLSMGFVTTEQIMKSNGNALR